MMTTRATRIRRRGAPPALISVLASLILLAGASTPVPALAETTGFWYGADSGAPGPANSDPPYDEPSCGTGHRYGGYIGKIGGADLVSSSNPAGYGPGNTFAWNAGFSAAADTNHFRYGIGVGAGGYWFMFGPEDTDGTGLCARGLGPAAGQVGAGRLAEVV